MPEPQLVYAQGRIEDYMGQAGEGLDFEGQVKPSAIEVDAYEKDLFAHRHVTIPSNMQGRWVYDGSNNPIYAGYAPRGLAESANGWLLHKMVWVSGNCTSRTIAYDSWANYLTADYQ
jgi:hypothetical protein